MNKGLALALMGFLTAMAVTTDHAIVAENAPIGAPVGRGVGTTNPLSESDHPRLFFGPEDIPELRQLAGTTHDEIWPWIEVYTDKQLGSLPPVASPADGGLDFYRESGNRLIPIAFTCVITGQPDHCDLARQYLLRYAGWSQWGEHNWRDLGHAHMLMGNALAYDWVSPHLTPDERTIVRQSLAGWAQKMYEASADPDGNHAWQNWWRNSYLQNHHWTNNSALGLTGLALLGEDDRAPVWVAHAAGQLSRVRDILDGIQDGSWHEGIPYQNYGLTMTLPFLVNLRALQGIDYLPHTYLRSYSAWRLYNLLPGSPEFNLAYGNFEWFWANDYGPQALLRFTAREYRDGHAEWSARQITDATGRHANVWTPWYVFEFLYFDPAIQPRSPEELPGARVFPDLEGLIWRTGWGAQDLVFGLKTGAYGGRFNYESFTTGQPPWDCTADGCQMNIGHDDADSGTFFIHRGGEWLVPETLGRDYAETTFHNTLLIDGQGQFRPSGDWRNPIPFIDSDGSLQTAVSTPGFDYAVVDSTRSYKTVPGLLSVSRHVVFIRPDYLLMVDNLAAEDPHRYEWVAHFSGQVSVEGRWVRSQTAGDQSLGVQVIAPASFDASTGNDGNPYVRIGSATSNTDARLVHLLFPADEERWEQKPTAELLADTGQAILVRLEEQDHTDDVLLAMEPAAAGERAGPYWFDGTAAVIVRSKNGDLERLFVYGGNALTDSTSGARLLTISDNEAAVELLFSPHNLTLTGSFRGEVTVYAPDARALKVNGEHQAYLRCGDYVTFNPGFHTAPFFINGLNEYSLC